jgi:hypothetical protein
MGVDMGPWVVTIWLKEWPMGTKKKLEFDKITKSLLEAKLNKVMNKKNPRKVHGVWIPANMVRFEIRSKR